MSTYSITRRIEIDAGHRIRSHGSKCRHLHGHRYAIEATCVALAGVQRQGEQSGMVLDFGFLKQAMMELIDAGCDHGLIVDIADEELLALFAPEGAVREQWLAGLRQQVEQNGYCLTVDTRLQSKLYIIAAPPTAECLAQHWFERLAPEVVRLSGEQARLQRLRVWETPNCYADFVGEERSPA
ncbi:MAG TPA: 6-carboxytetrahydropterin synthase [Gammaproteobacteria bacterium]|nr:6-carboxytetrahydropterin synthase [Gammaproteobacteria bacterium]